MSGKVLFSFCFGFALGAAILFLHNNVVKESTKVVRHKSRQSEVGNTTSHETNHLRQPMPGLVETTTAVKEDTITDKAVSLSSNNSRVSLMEVVQSERRYTLQAACRRWKKDFKGVSEKPNKRALYSVKYKVAICDIFKCGYTSWLQTVLVFEEFFNNEDYFKQKINGGRVMKLANQNTRVGSRRNSTQSQLAWDNSILKIITVRNPFSRLVSAYNDKMKPDSPGFTYVYGPLSKKINKEFRHLRSNPLDRNRTDDGTATFEDFLNFVLASKKKDDHWQFFDTKCNPCVHRYNHIMKFESFREDVSYISDALKLNEHDSEVFFPKRDFKSNFAKVEKHFAKIPKDLSQKIHEHYKMDFELFGYEKPHWIE